MTLLDDLIAAQARKRKCRVVEFIKTLEPGLGAQLLDVIDNHPEIATTTLLKTFPGLTSQPLYYHRNGRCPC